jgi:CHAD domain-containing protein
MYPLAARRALARRLDILARELPAALAGEVEPLHRARVASRRLRELIAVFQSAPGSDDENGWWKVQKRARRVTRALGGVREADVTLEVLDKIVATHPETTPGVILARAAVSDEREARRRDMLERVDESDVAKLRNRLERLTTTRAVRLRDGTAFDLEARVLARAADVDRAVEDAGTLYALDRLHQVRIAAKKLRYAVELAEELRGVGTRRIAGRIRRMQDLLGRMHDLAVVAEFGRRPSANGSRRGGRSDTTALLLETLDRETRTQHAKYLSDVASLMTVVHACRHELVPRLERQRRHPSNPIIFQEP